MFNKIFSTASWTCGIGYYAQHSPLRRKSIKRRYLSENKSPEKMKNKNEKECFSWQIDIQDSEKMVEVWLTNTEKMDPAI